MIDLAAVLLSLVPATPGHTIRCVEIGAGAGAFSSALLNAYPHATLTAFEQVEPARSTAAAATARFDSRIVVHPFDPAALDWWDVMFGATAVIAPNGLASLNDAKKQYLFKAAADRLADKGALLIADRLARGTLLHHLIWLRHAGFPTVDCFARDADLVVFGGVK